MVSIEVTTAYDYAVRLMEERCRKAGCTAPASIWYAAYDMVYVIGHGRERLELPRALERDAFADVVTWLNTLHAPLIEAREAAARLVYDASLT